MKNFLTRYYVVFILLAVFAAPGISAWYFFNHPELLGNSFTNKGILLKNPTKIAAITAKKWHLAFNTDEGCSDICMQQLEKLAKIRLALGRKLYDVDLNLLLNGSAENVSAALLTHINELGFQVMKVNIKQLPAVLIINPESYAVLGFHTKSNPADIYHDLKQLLSNPNGVNN